MINRLLGIVYTLLSKETVTAALLAERYEVSVRTIYRDIQVLSEAGIPVYARKGKNGGIFLTDQFVLNKMLISKEEQQQILSALLSMDETAPTEEKQVLQKLGNFFKMEPVNWVAIDFSDWSDGQKQLYEDIRRSILTNRVICFDYYNQNREMSRRTVEPIQLVFKEYTWYLSAYCREKKALRFFKLKRMKQLEVLEETFEPGNDWLKDETIKPRGDCAKEDASTENQPGLQEVSTSASVITMWVDKKEAYRVYDRFAESEIEILKDGNFMVHPAYPFIDEWVYSMILSFGASAEVLEPIEVREEIRRRIDDMKRRYKKNNE